MTQLFTNVESDSTIAIIMTVSKSFTPVVECNFRRNKSRLQSSSSVSISSYHLPSFITMISSSILAILILTISSLMIPGSEALQSAPFQIRICVPQTNYEYCLQMSNNLPGSIGCVPARDKFECMGLISKDQADLMNVDAEDLYLAGRIYNLEPFAMEEVNGNLYKYRSGVLIPKASRVENLNDLRGLRSCHTGVGRTAGWHIPVGHLLSNGIMIPDCVSELSTVAKFFDRSCAPGSWSSDPIIDRQLKKLHPSLCSLCKDSLSCSLSDEYSGYEGAIQCLLDGAGQVAFTTIDAVDKFFRERASAVNLIEDYQFLCLDGSRMPVTRRACEWSRRPSNTFIIRKGKVRQKEIYLRLLQQIYFRWSPYKPAWFTKSFVSSTNVTQITGIAYNQQNWEGYLGTYIPSIEKPMPGCERKNVTFCTTSQEELFKCLDMQKVAYSRRIRPDVRCIKSDGESKLSCINEIAARRADVVTLNPNDLYTAARYHGLAPIATEKRNDTDFASVFAVAVVKTNSPFVTLSDLRGARSCHTGFGTSEGWSAPVSTLLDQELIPRTECNRAISMAKFFRAGGSCVPGAGNTTINPNATGAGTLCQNCVGDVTGQHVCEANSNERFFGEAGAFRCLAEGRGDIAFVNHLTPFIFTDGKSPDLPWTFGLKSDDFRLLCKSGGQGFLTEFERCNIAKIPNHFIAAYEGLSRDERMNILTVVTGLNEHFSRKNPDSFNLFGSYNNQTNLLFDDSSTGLLSLPEEADYKSSLGDYVSIAQDMDSYYCLNGSTSGLVASWTLLSFFLLLSRVQLLN